MGSNVIGEVAIQISGDYSALQTDLAQAQNIASESGTKVAESFTQAAAATQTLEQRVQSLVDSGSTLAQALATIQKQDQDTAAALDQVAKAAEAAKQPVVSLEQALADFGESAGIKAKADSLNQALSEFANTAGKQVTPAVEQASQSVKGLDLNIGSLVKGAVALAGIELSFHGIKAAIEESLSAFAQLQRATESLTALTGSAKLADDAIVQLRHLAEDEALSFPSLLKADQQMAAFGLSTKQAVPLLAAAGDAARATGKDFDTVVNSVERIVESGAASGRTLVNLGLSTADLGKVMGVTSDQAAKLFKSLDEATRVDVLTTALNRFKGLASDTADDLSGSWQKISNVAHEEFTRVGAELAELGPAFTTFSTGAIHALGVVADFFVTFVNTIIQKGGDLANYLKNQAVSWGISVEDYGKATKDATDANDRYEKSIGTLTIAARQLFNGFPDYNAQLNSLLKQFQQGEIDGSLFTTKLLVMEGQFKSLHPEVKTATENTGSFSKSVADLNKQLTDGTINQATYNSKLQDLIKSHQQASSNAAAHKEAIKQLEQEYKAWAHGLDQAGTSLSNLFQHITEVDGAMRTNIGTAKDQAAAYQGFIVASTNAAAGFSTAALDIIKTQNDLEAKANALAAAWTQLAAGYEKGTVDQAALARGLADLKTAMDAAGISVGDLAVPLKTVGDAIPVVSGGITKLQSVGEDVSPVIDGLNKQLQDLGANAGAFDIHTAKVNATRDAYGFLRGAATSAYQAVIDGGKNAVQIVTDFNQVVDASGNIISSAMAEGVTAVNSFDAAIKQAAQDFSDFASGVGSFGSQLGIDGGTGTGAAKGKHGGGGSFNLANPYWNLSSPDEMMAAYNDLQASFGGSAFNDFSGASFLLANQRALLNAAIQNYYAENPTSLSSNAPASSAPTPRPSTAPTAPTAAGPTYSPDISYFLSQGIPLSDIATGLTTLNSTLADSTTTLAQSFASLTPVMQTATQQVTQAISQQAASFQTLATALAPITAPATTPYAPASFSRTGTPSPLGSPLGGSSVTINGLNFTATPDEQATLNNLMDTLQRRGIRF